MEERYRLRLNPTSWGKIASPWFAYKQVDETDAKECSVCWDKCTSYLHCSNSEGHIVCKDCSKEMVENTHFVNPDASIDIKWKCPLCRYDNELGTWQFLPSTEQAKAKEVSQQSRRDTIRQDIIQNIERGRAERERTNAVADRLIQQARTREQQRQEQQQAHDTQIIENRVSRIDENVPSKFRWVLSLNWKNSIVNHFKAWIMYTSSNYVENRDNRPPSGAELTTLKQVHFYEDRKRSTQAPWFKFLERTTPP
mgnify:CR=1 FL=1